MSHLSVILVGAFNACHRDERHNQGHREGRNIEPGTLGSFGSLAVKETQNYAFAID